MISNTAIALALIG